MDLFYESISKISFYLIEVNIPCKIAKYVLHLPAYANLSHESVKKYNRLSLETEKKKPVGSSSQFAKAPIQQPMRPQGAAAGSSEQNCLAH